MTAIRDASANMPRFSLLGGPLYRLGVAAGLVRGRTNTVRMGLAIGLGLWLVAAVLGVLAGRELFSLDMLGAHVRLLLAIPLMFFAESLIDPRLDDFMHVVVRSRIVPGEAALLLQQKLARVTRWKDGWLPDVICLLLAVGFNHIVPYLPIPGLDSTARAVGVTDLSVAGVWYSVVCLGVLRFLLLRWILRLLLWMHCLWFLSRLPLRLVPAHADGVAGLGGLEVVHAHFAPLLLSISAVLAASFAVDIADGVMALEAVYPAAAAILLLDALIFVGPLLLFAPKLWACKVQGISDYMVLAEAYAGGFERKWLRGEGPAEELLGSSDIQSLADLTTAVTVVREQRIVPASPRMLINLAIVALVPLAPLVLFKIPLTELAGQILGRLTGL